MSKIGEKFIFEITETGLACDNTSKLVSGEVVVFVAENRMSTLKKYPSWIPVSKGVPTEEGMYIACFDDGFITGVEYTNDWELWADSGEVIAWMPLPEPYKG